MTVDKNEENPMKFVVFSLKMARALPAIGSPIPSGICAPVKEFHFRFAISVKSHVIAVGVEAVMKFVEPSNEYAEFAFPNLSVVNVAPLTVPS